MMSRLPDARLGCLANGHHGGAREGDETVTKLRIRHSMLAKAVPVVLGAALGAPLLAPMTAGAAGGADLSITIDHTPSLSVAGVDKTNFTVTVRNDGPESADGVVVAWSSNFSFQIDPTTLPDGCRVPSQYGGLVLCTIGTMGSGTTATRSFTAQPYGEGLIEVTSVVSSNTPDPDSNDRTAKDMVIVSPGPSSQELAVGDLYQRFLGRTPSDKDRKAWGDQWSQAPFDQRGSVPLGILTSPEALGRRIGDLYERLLGRAASASERAAWTSWVQAGSTIEGVRLAILGSPEFTSHNGGPTGAINAMYEDILGRSPSPAEHDNALARLDGASMTDVAAALLYSPDGLEHELAVETNAAFERNPDNFDRLVWLSAVRSGASFDSQYALLFASYEYINRFSSYPIAYPVGDYLPA